LAHRDSGDASDIAADASATPAEFEDTRLIASNAARSVPQTDRPGNRHPVVA
jgi:hypothetical protein